VIVRGIGFRDSREAAGKVTAVRRLNLFAAELDRSSEREGFRWRGSRLGQAIGAEEIGAGLYELEAGQRTYPYHSHHAMEEWLIVVSGSPTLRTPIGERVLREGDVVCFPVGPDGAHRVTGPGTVLIVSDNRAPDTVEYPDSGKVGLGARGPVFRLADAVDVWEGE
jgi:uncharacterized cupin superfamily protein